MLTNEDKNFLNARGISEEVVLNQVERFKTGFPYLKIYDSARPGEGITILTKEEESQAVSRWDTRLLVIA